MTTPSQFDPLAKAPRSILSRIALKFGRTVEPLAVNLLAWCRSLDHRVESVESRLEGSESQIRAMAHSIRNIEALVPALEAAGELGKQLSSVAKRTSTAEATIRSLESRADQTYWAREALVERMNQDDTREEQIVHRVATLEERAEQLSWGREALVERMNRGDAVVESVDHKVTELQAKVDEQVPLPLSFGLDYLAMGRRLAALEDQLEMLLVQPGKAQDCRTATLVAFPAQGDEKAAG